MTGTNLTLPIILSVAEIFGLLSIGGATRFLKYLDENDIDRWSKLVLDFLFPAYIFSTITVGFRSELLGELWPLPLIGLCLPLVCLLIGIPLRYGLRSKDPDTVRTYFHFCIVNNYGYLPIVIVRNLWGDTMVANLFFFNIGSTIALWTIGIGVLGSTDIKQILRNLLTPNLIATVAALAVAGLGWNHLIPKVVTHIIASAGSAAVPMMLVLAGASMFKPSAWRVTYQVVYISVVRLLFLPVCTIVALKMLPLSEDVYKISVIVALMPLAVSSVIFTRIFGGKPDFAASASLVTTLAGIVTVPMALWVLFK
jgi:predicted permease